MENNMSYLYNNKVGFIPEAIDAFGRLQTVGLYTLFDSQHRYQDNGKFDTHAAIGGTATHNINESTVSMTVGTTSGSEVIRESKVVMPYQPGKGLLSANTFVFNTPKNGLRQRVGYFGSQNGVFLEQDGLTAYFVLRSYVTGTTDDSRKIAQSSWNEDPFNGSGPSGRTIDFTKANIFWTDIEWLGVGDVRCGFYVDGRPVIAHVFHNDNLYNTTYMTTATLPVRLEITNTSGQTGSSTMKQICNTVISQGGYEPISIQKTTDGITSKTSTTVGTYVPFTSIRLKSSRLDAVVIPSGLEITGESNKIIAWALFVGGTLSGSSGFVSFASDSAVEYNTSASGITGGKMIYSGFINGSESIQLSGSDYFYYQLGRTISGISDMLTLAFTAVDATNPTAYGSIQWYENI